ncbi:MAG: PQQ-dependent sugar dehydrogenase [Pseudomonadales bacterium]|nr:PQQ-dependent sugar dehydrogenase [Pseudomonadales bacterium]
MRTKKPYRALSLVAIASIQFGCGGGGSGSSAPPPPPPPPPGDLVGLPSRPSNTTCVAPARITGGTVSLELAFPNLPALNAPMKLIQPRNDSSQFFAVLRDGGLERFSNTPGVASSTRYLNVPVSTTGENGFLSAVFHPEWPSRREIFVSYVVNENGAKSRLSRLIVTNDTNLPAAFTEQVLLTIDQPSDIHNGGDLAIGNDGLVYYSLGDGGESVHSQNRTRLLGKLLRIDAVNVAYPTPGYNIPSSNPYAGNPRCGAATNTQNCPEIYALGFRNPWRFSIDAPTGQIWLADVGQGSREEVNQVTVGGNYGWHCREGSLPFNSSGCLTEDFTDPVFEYPHSDGNASVTGGYVYRGTRAGALIGSYIFGDWTGRRIWALRPIGVGYQATELGRLSNNLPAFSQGNDGEVYALTGSGLIYRFAASGGVIDDNVPDLLTETGCIDASIPHQPASGLVPYAPAAEFWSDNATKTRWIGLPNGATIDVEPNDDWIFPPGSVLVKNFQLQGVLIETRLFMRHPDGEWAGYTYQWNAGQTQATRVRNGATRRLGEQTWIYPSEAECMACHTEVGGFTLGPETAQMNSNFLYVSTGITDNQLEVFNHIGMFSAPVPEPVNQLPALTSPSNSAASLNARARAYLHTNCSQCHQPGGPDRVELDFRYSTPLSNTGACDTLPQTGDLGIGDARIIAPGNAVRSVLSSRVNRRDQYTMPPLSSNVIDAQGVSLLTLWINSLTGCT